MSLLSPGLNDSEKKKKYGLDFRNVTSSSLDSYLGSKVLT